MWPTTGRRIVITVLAANLVLAGTGFIRSAMLERQGEVDGPEIPNPPTKPWHTYDIVVKCAMNKSYKVVGGLYVSSPYFEIAALLFIVSAGVISFFIVSLLGLGHAAVK
jgi:hypothetical protein